MKVANRIVAAAASALCCAALAAPVQAQLSQPWTWCVNKEKASPDLQINGCTKVIQSGRQTNKNLSIAFNNRGNGYRDKNDNDRAIADYNEAIRLNPKNPYPYNGRGNAWHAKGENDRAIADYDQAIKVDPKYAPPYNGRGNVWRDRGENDRAIADYDMAIKLDPRHAYAYNGRGNAYNDKKEYDRAIADYTESIRIDPHIPPRTMDAAMHTARRASWIRRCPTTMRRSGSIRATPLHTMAAAISLSTSAITTAPSPTTTNR